MRNGLCFLLSYYGKYSFLLCRILLIQWHMRCFFLSIAGPMSPWFSLVNHTFMGTIRSLITAAGLRLQFYCWNILMTFLFMVPWNMEKVLQKKGYKGIKFFLKVMGLASISIRMSFHLGVAAGQERL